MILSDREIRTLCSNEYYVQRCDDLFGEVARRYISAEKYRVLDRMDPRSRAIIEKTLRVVRDQPMISPFVGTSVREKPRHATPEELRVFSPQHMLTGEEQLVALRRIAPNAAGVEYVKNDDPGKGGMQVREKIISYGCSSYGYDVRLAREFKIFTNVNSTTVDPKELDPKSFVDFEGDVCIIPPNSFILARTVERFCMPPDVVGLCVGKSTIARAGIITLCTPLEPGWEGYLTLEFANTTPLPAKMYAGEGALQIQFFQGPPCEVSYRDRGGKYQNQKAEITLPIP